MTIPSKLESYLSTLDKTLGPISISERAEIVTEIKSHVLEAQERDPSQNLDAVLASLGEPEQVASKYLLERGLKPAKASKRPIVKWLVMGFLGTVFLILAFITLLIFKFSPLIQINDSDERVALLGGLIDINGKTGSVDIGGAHIRGHGKILNGSRAMDMSKVNQIFIPFTNGKFSLSTSADNKFSWECKMATEDEETDPASVDKNVLKFDLGKTSGSQCDFEIPARASLGFSGNNLKMTVHKPAYNLEVKAQNGDIELAPDAATPYHFDIKALNGKIDSFESSPEKNALKISISLVNGVINRRSL